MTLKRHVNTSHKEPTMNAIDAIFKRRSIRKYTNAPIELQVIETILSAGFSAHSAHNGQPWEFIVIKNKETIKALAEVKKYYVKPLSEAEAAIAVLINPNTEKPVKLDYMYQDCAAATENMLIAATALGLGSCWMGGLLEENEMSKVDEILALPSDIIFFGLISLGYPGEEKEAKGTLIPEKVHYEKY